MIISVVFLLEDDGWSSDGYTIELAILITETIWRTLNFKPKILANSHGFHQ